jgi:hypothetical protein
MKNSKGSKDKESDANGSEQFIAYNIDACHTYILLGP